MSRNPSYKQPVEQPNGFDITAVVGHVNFGGDRNPVEAAFDQIGTQAARMDLGDVQTYRFDPSGENRLFIEVEVRLPVNLDPEQPEGIAEADYS